ncbi:MAG: hypothetical protein IT579_05665 [Verrucomicrobia subdivision 3 bacterium]|nr:hypothetical protein [Limisphaerales bacterium]
MNYRLFHVVPSVIILSVVFSTGLFADNTSIPTTNPPQDKTLSGTAPRERFADTNQTDHAMAYKQVVARQMLAEVNFYVERLNLPESRPIKNTSVRVAPPGRGLGAVETRDFLYSFLGSDRKPITNEHGADWFLEHGKLAYIIRKEPFELITHELGNDPSVLTEKLASLRSRINTNQAYQLATQWLAAVDVDITALEKRYPPMVAQQFAYVGPITWKLGEEPPPNTPRKLLPVFDVTWGGAAESSPPVWVEIFGATKELIHLRMEDTRYSKRSPIVITNELELIYTPDPPKKQMVARTPMYVSPAYHKAATAMMLMEANFLIRKLGLHESNPLLATQVVAHVADPKTRERGYLKSENFEFHFEEADSKPHKSPLGREYFGEPGKLIMLMKRNAWREYQNQADDFEERFFHLPSLIHTNEAYQMAMQWLASIQVDVAALEKKYKPRIVHAECGNGNGVQRKVPVFNVTWGGASDQEPIVCMSISGLTRELVYLSIADTRFSKRQPIVVPNALELNKSQNPPTK